MNQLISLSSAISDVIKAKCQVACGGRGLEIRTDLKYEEWATLVGELSRIQDSYQFMIGDLIAYGEDRYDRGRYLRASELTGRKFQTIHQWASACRAIPPHRRKFNLKWVHYYESAFNLTTTQQDHLLQLAENNCWSGDRLREEVNLIKAGYHDLDVDHQSIVLPTVPKKAIPKHKVRKIQAGEKFGDRLDFKGMAFGPTNEMGVVALFALLADRLGYCIELVRVRFPDCLAKKKVGDTWEHCEIEFEYRSSDFDKHGHDVDSCDLIVCWHDDWDDAPIPVLCLKDYIKK